MQISLPKDIEAWAREEVAAGRATSVDALVEAALRARRTSANELRSLIMQGIESGERDGWLDGDSVDAELARWVAEDEAAAFEGEQDRPKRAE